MGIDVKESTVQEVNRAAQEEPKNDGRKRRKPKESAGKTVLRVVISLVVIALGIFVILYVVSKAAHYDSIAAMLQHMWGEVTYMWENRLTN